MNKQYKSILKSLHKMGFKVVTAHVIMTIMSTIRVTWEKTHPGYYPNIPSPSKWWNGNKRAWKLVRKLAYSNKGEL